MNNITNLIANTPQSNLQQPIAQIIPQASVDQKPFSKTSPPRASDIKSQLRNFINLLQTGTDHLNYQSIRSTGKLSVILSASEPESSTVDKQNQSANRSIKNSQFQTNQKSMIQSLIKQLMKTSLTVKQQSILSQINQSLCQINKKRQFYQNKSLLLQNQLNQQKKGTDQLLQALMKMDQQQKQLWMTYYQLSQKYNQSKLQLQKKQEDILKAKQQTEICKKQLKFVKKLVFVANSNYEELEKEYKKISHKNNVVSRNTLKPVLVLRQKRSERNLLTQRSVSNISKHSNKHIYSPLEEGCKNKGLSPDQYEISSSCSPMRKSSISLKSRKSISPLQRDKENIQCNFKDVYRKMLLKNQKSKKNHHLK